MSKALSFALLSLAAITAITSAASAQSLQVMTWNIRYDNPGDGENRWRNRKDWFAEIVVREKVDIAGFQEVLTGQYEDLQKRLPDLSSYGVGRDDGEKQGEMTPIFYRTSRFELLDRGTFWLSAKPDKVGSVGWDASLTRITSWLKLLDRETKATFFVLNAHFDHRGNEARRESAVLIVKKIQTDFAAHPVLFLGDLNSLPASAAYKTLTAERSTLRDAYEHAREKTGPDSTWNGFKKIQPGNRIDYLFASDNIAIEQLRTLADQREGKFPSDHLPIVARLSLPPK